MSLMMSNSSSNNLLSNDGDDEQYDYYNGRPRRELIQAWMTH